MTKGSSRMDRGGRALRAGAPAAGGRMWTSGESRTTDRTLRLRRSDMIGDLDPDPADPQRRRLASERTFSMTRAGGK